MPRKSPSPTPQPARAEAKAVLHPRNRHTGRYDFPALIAGCPELAEHVIINPYGKQSIDFANPDAVRVFNRALLRQFYGIQHWDIPPGYLCPPVPGRADYLHGLADLLAQNDASAIPRGTAIHALDIGTGANCIYPLIGHREYGWRFTGSDIDATALASAHTIVSANGLAKAIELRQQAAPKHIFKGMVLPEDRFDLTLCNPPFHASQAEASSGSQRKWRNLGKLDPSRKLPALNFGGQAAELWCEGGEAAFVARMAEESALFAGQVYWFSTLVSKGANVAPLEARLKRLGARQVHTLDMAQGQKKSRFVAWTFLTEAEQATWRAERWPKG
ncbi:MAG: 23S rRNA (adenine(1618)-N(6))-methyltransferase RlmF [Gammaproteobacteria bacterium HGW-Gammaproteobacteria-9]|uniref:Ribosomal RNA large subunit methyltransferase F n=1 Tax=Stutzerimonas stutzeri RCH2 TaxID=644801 RepID=L0GIE7_STUST|nr:MULTISPECIES: 23S rRNA (adenine(1618)-N(6))-methyltransferase RlmF [Pseudomonadaceae]AGA85791.1 putative SAM-dependent methyltransferase [Stutzerimonas stutzeri RCH2]PKM00172.1 MAG: 23S rRNA (adenine(1618)-N(6))-methyltransferase RlmF [Gammaproteobacteria bacterium HGW-Gammaproteobacteria-9]GCA54874.1 ribosomal RNA large subunit methyltransferase F [Pseudomonas sp. SCT]